MASPGAIKDVRRARPYEVLGGPASFNVVVTTKKFREANPRAYRAYMAALQESIETINRDKRAAAETYLRMSKDKSSVDEILAMLNARRR